MQAEYCIVNSRPDREIRKNVLVPGDYDQVPYEDSRCKILLSDIVCKNENGEIEIETESRYFCSSFDGNLVIGDSDFFIDKDLELILMQMCYGEMCSAVIVYRDNVGKLVKEISCTIELKEVTEEQLVSDWSIDRLHEASLHHKERGVQLVKEKRIIDAFRRFNKALKMLIAMEPMDPELVDEERVKELIDLKVKLYNNLTHCQLQYNEYEAALDLSNRAIKYDPNNVKALYRRCISYSGLKMYEEAWTDIQQVLKLDPTDKAALKKANELKPAIEKINQSYSSVIKKMFN